MADTTATAAEHADRPAKPGLSIDAKWIVTTGVAIALLQVAFVSMTFQQNATINPRIDDTNAQMREMRAEFRTDIRELRGMLLQLLERTAPANPVD